MPPEAYSLPKYFSISRELIAMIHRGDLHPGGLVPSENDIIDQYQVSNTTARKALHELEKAGWVTRIKGKGTFVRAQPVRRSIDRLFGFTKNMREAGRRPSTRLIGYRLRDDDRVQTVNGREFVMKGPHCEIERLRLADGIPMMREIRYISLRVCPDIHKKNLEKSLYDVFEKYYGIHLVEINQMLSAVILSGKWLDAFQLKDPVPAFRVEGVSFGGKGVIVEMEDAIYRGDMYQFAAKALPSDQPR